MALAGMQCTTYWWTPWPSKVSGHVRSGQHSDSLFSHTLRVPPIASRSSEPCQTLSKRFPSRFTSKGSVQKGLRAGIAGNGRMKAVASEITGQSVEEIEDADIANRNPYLEGDFVIEDDEEWEEVTLHRVKIHDTKGERTFEVDVPEDRYILHSAEEQGHTLPFACRMGCCTSCAVRVKSGKLYQPLALGISNELKAQGYALMCVAYPLSDVEIETQDEDEVYYLQFGRYFAKGPIERDDIALEIALQDE